jgi:ectoine hydroxylase-related dioxygenase (phytanoyl-CoA dioxygenase family)
MTKEAPDSKIADSLIEEGYAIVPRLIDHSTISLLIDSLAKVKAGPEVRMRQNKAFAIRKLLDVVPAARELASSDSIRKLVEPLLGIEARVVRGAFFDKTPEANWKIVWHQDTTIAVKEKREVAGYGPWSIKAGVFNVQPPASVLERMLAIRIHLDDTDESNGALRVIPGSHKDGIMEQDEIDRWKQKATPVVCAMKSGWAMMMKPLLLHASSPSINPSHRRVLHLEYANFQLDGGLEWYGS